MHELSLCKRISEIVFEELTKHPGKSVKMIHLDLGELMLVEKDALLFGFKAVITNTVLQNAELIITDVPGEGWCPQCSQWMAIKNYVSFCDRCGNIFSVTRGNDLQVRAIELE